MVCVEYSILYTKSFSGPFGMTGSVHDISTCSGVIPVTGLKTALDGTVKQQKT